MIVASKEPYKLGERFTIYRHIEILKERQPCVAIREATRQEFIDFWMTHELRNKFIEMVQEQDVPYDYNFYEVSTD